MDNPATESSAPLTIDGAAATFSAILEQPAQADETPEVENTAEPAAEPVTDAEQEASADDDPTVTIKIDGKDVPVKLSELKNGYQRQADYTRKTMEVSEQRKAAEAQIAQAVQERQAYAQNLQRMQVQLEGALAQQQQSINWQQLLETDPQRYLQERHLAEQRQAALQQNYAAQQQLAAIRQAEEARSLQSHLEEQSQRLVELIPALKDEAQAKATKTAIRDYLIKQGYDEQSVNNVADARAVVLAHKAMQYDAMVAKANAAAKKVGNLPTKVERPGTGDNPSLDKRTSAFQRLSKSGRVEDAAAVFSSLL